MTPDDDEKIGHEVQVERIEKGKVIKIPDTAFTTWVAFGYFSSFSLMVRQISSLLDLPLHGSDRICIIWVGRESQMEKGRCLKIRWNFRSSVPKVHLPTCG